MPTASSESPKRFVLYLPRAAAEATEGLIPAAELIVCRRFGGLTTYSAVGMYENKKGTVQREEVIVLEGYGESESWEYDRAILYGLAATLAVFLNQEAIGCSVDGRLYLVEPEKATCRLDPKNPERLEGALLEESSRKEWATVCPW
jgi:hypothetical protein